MDMVETSSLLALTLGAGWASGNQFSMPAVVVLGDGSVRQDTRTCPGELDAIQSPWVIGAAGPDVLAWSSSPTRSLESTRYGMPSTLSSVFRLAL